MDKYREVRPLRAILFYSVYSLVAVLPFQFSVRIAAAQTLRQDALIQTLFGELPPDINALDANGDGALTVADILLLGPESQFTPTPTPTPTETATPTETFTPTPSPTQVGTLFVGTIADLVPHGVGDQLVYRVTDPVGKVTTETTIVLSSEPDGSFVLDDKTVNGAQVLYHQTQNYMDTGSQLLVSGGSDLVSNGMTSGLKTTCTPEPLQLMVPVIAGEMFSTTSHCEVHFIRDNTFVGFIDRVDTFTPIDVVASVTVPAGTYANVLHFTGAITLSGALETDEIYVAPGVGIVQRLQTAGGKTTKKELTGGTIGGQPVAR
jgi:hypothetical protein